MSTNPNDRQRLGEEIDPSLRSPAEALATMPHGLLGQVIAEQYRIERHLDTGGFGDVFRAIQLTTGQLVALKVLRPRQGKGAPSLERQVARFRREMKACGELHHPHIVRLVDAGQTDGALFFTVFEYVPGLSLAEFVRERGALTVRMTIELMTQVLDALICAHGKGIVHRDLKPENIMVSTTGFRPQATILDFGVSAFLEGTAADEYPSLTMTREILGTPAYAAPEQLRGQPATAKSDLYAWGLIFAECLTGRRVFDFTTPLEMVHSQLSSSPIVLPTRLQRHRLGKVLRWVVEKDLARRAGDATAVMNRLSDNRTLLNLEDPNGYLREDSADLDASGDEDGNVDSPCAEPVRTVRPAERRQITAMCCSVTIARLTPAPPAEVLDWTLSDARSLCSEIVQRFGGHPAGHVGGQLLACFGMPRASDADTRRAAIAALEIAREVRRRGGVVWAAPIDVRIGIHTGLVTVPTAEKPSAAGLSGLTPECAAQLAREAPANSILLSVETALHLASSFELQENPSGDDEKNYRLLAERTPESALASGLASDPVPFVGREHELGRLRDAWQRARQGQGSTVLLLGEAGMGKSRLLRELRNELRTDGFHWIEARCLPETQQSPLKPILELLSLELRIPAEATAPDQRLVVAQLEASLREIAVDLKTAIPLLLFWLGLPLPEGYVPLPFSPQKQKAMLIDLLADVLVAIAERRSAPILIEDLHWADQTTREFIERLVRGATKRGCLLLLSARPDLESNWCSDRVECLSLKPLEPVDVQRIIAALTKDRPLLPRFMEHALRRSDGVPLFVEEIVRFLQERPPVASGEAVPPVQVPARLRDLLTGRLDHLGRAKETAQLAATIGREFPYELLLRLHTGDEASLLADLDQMVSSELLIRGKVADTETYLFRHALIRDATYESMLEPSRREAHRHLAMSLETSLPKVTLNDPELLARHWAAAGEHDKAITYAMRAMEGAQAKCLYHEAALRGTEALGWLNNVPDSPSKLEMELELVSLLAPALMATSGWGSAVVRKQIDRAEYLSQRCSERSTTQCTMLWLLLMYHNVRANWDRFDEARGRALSLAAARRDRGFECVVRAIAAQTLIIRGRLQEARTQSELALQLYDSDEQAAHRRRFGQDVEVFALGGMGMLLTLMGFPDQARHAANQALEKAELLRSPYSECMARAYLAGTYHYLGLREPTRQVTETLLKDSELFGIAEWPPIARILSGWADQQVDEPERELDRMRSIGNRYAGPYWDFTIAQTEHAKGSFVAAISRIDRAIEQSAELGVLYYVPELHRLKGECLAALATVPDQTARVPWQAAERAFETAIVVARRQAARLPELRATIGLTKLRRQHCPSRANDGALAELVAWFTEGFDQPELAEARSLLEH